MIGRIIRAWDRRFPVERRDVADDRALATFGQTLSTSPIALIIAGWASGAVSHQEIGTRVLLVCAATGVTHALLAAAKAWVKWAKVPDPMTTPRKRGGPI